MATTAKVNTDELTEWLKAKVLPNISKIIKKSCDNVTLEITVPDTCLFVSEVYFVKIKFTDNETLSVVVKIPVSTTLIGDPHTDALFHNEVLFYEKFAPNSTRYPRCFYAYEDVLNWKMSSIVTENVETMGFKMCPQAFNIPMEYIMAGVREIAKFHATGYAMKTNQSAKFFSIVDSIEESRYFPGEWNETTINYISPRPINYLRKNNYDSTFCDKMGEHLSRAFQTVMLDAVKPCEPLAVLCHGDFTRNNIFYRQIDSQLEGMLIDFAMLRYSSPAIDLSTFLYISCSAEDICDNFNDIFKAYHSELIDYLQKLGIDEVDAYSYDKMLVDYKRRAMFGYIIALFFIPAQRGLVTVDLTSESADDLRRFNENTMKAGGDELSKEFADLLINLRSSGCLKHVLSE